MEGKDSEITTVDRQTGEGTPKGVLLIVCFALFFGVLNASAVWVVLPDIADDLSVNTGQLSWLMTGFLLIYGIAIPFYGRLADCYGARPLFILGLGIFRSAHSCPHWRRTFHFCWRHESSRPSVARRSLAWE